MSTQGNAIRVVIQNTDHVAGTEMTQLYLELSASAGGPPKALRGFEELILSVEQSGTATFSKISVILGERASSLRLVLITVLIIVRDVAFGMWCLNLGLDLVEISLFMWWRICQKYLPSKNLLIEIFVFKLFIVNVLIWFGSRPI
jgi:hypothetical protein